MPVKLTRQQLTTGVNSEGMGECMPPTHTPNI